LQAEQRFNGIGAYNSKLAIVLFTYELARRLEGTGVTVNCVHPGVVRSTALGRGERFPLPVRVAWTLLRPFMKSPSRARTRRWTRQPLRIWMVCRAASCELPRGTHQQGVLRPSAGRAPVDGRAHLVGLA
jgi:NAD(P)-dependent dehydrogenase (short-subunit alcohol dehydrogenase family)